MQKETQERIKRERADDAEADVPQRSRSTRRRNGDTQLEIDDDGSFRETSRSSLTKVEPEVIVLDD